MKQNSKLKLLIFFSKLKIHVQHQVKIPWNFRCKLQHSLKFKIEQILNLNSILDLKKFKNLKKTLKTRQHPVEIVSICC